MNCNGFPSRFDNFGAHVDPTDPPFSCRFGGPAQGVSTVWRKFEATSPSAKLSLNQSDESLDTLLAVYSGTCGNLTELACSDDEGFHNLSELFVDGLTVGETYYVQVASYDRFELGHIVLQIVCPNPAPPNDTCEGAIDLGPLPASAEVGLRDAFTDPVLCGTQIQPRKNVWYRVTGTGNVLTATVCHDRTLQHETEIMVFCGDCGGRICVAGARSTFCPSFPRATVSWCSQPGAEYLITIGTEQDDSSGSRVHLDVLDTGEPCEPDVSCLPTGACCLAAGACVDTTAQDCAARGGSYRGDGSACTPDAVADGDFEAGFLSGFWEEFSTNFGSPLCNVQSCGLGGGTGPRSGSFWAWFGGTFAFEQGSLEQEVVIPAGAQSLDFYLEIPVSSGNGEDFLRVLVDGLPLFEVFEGDPVFSGVGYQLVSIPLTSFANGASHAVRFESITTGQDASGEPVFSNFFVDDVSITSPGERCTVVLDFETEDDLLTPLGNGQAIDTEFGNLVVISGAGANLGPATFDTTPGGPNDPALNDDMLIGYGNVLLLQHSSYPRQTVPGFFDTVTDDDEGGDLIFDFLQPVDPRSLLLADINPPPNLGASVTLIDGNGRTRVYDVEPGWTGTYGDAGPWRLDLTTTLPQPGNGTPRWARATEMAGFEQDGVVRIVVHLTGFGAIDELAFRR